MPWASRRDDDVVQLGNHVRVHGVGDVTVVFAAGMPVRRIERGDEMALRLELAALEAVSLVTQAQVAKSGLVAEATFHRDCVAYQRRGVAGAVARMTRGRPVGSSKVKPSTLRQMKRLRANGKTVGAIGQALGLGQSTVSSWLRKERETAETAETATLPGVSMPAPQVEPSPEDGASVEAVQDGSAQEDTSTAPEGDADVEASDEQRRVAEAAQAAAAEATSSGDAVALRIAVQRDVELMMGRLGQIEEQSALFPPTPNARYAGVLLGVALLTVTQLLPTVRKVLGVLPNGLYGVRSVVTTMVAMALLRCKRPEQLKGFDPVGLGAVLGLCRAPEMKTLRRKFKLLCGNEQAVRSVVMEMAKHHVQRSEQALGFLYLDGHVRPYFGETKVGKAHVASMRIALPATTDYWVCDAHGEPVLVIITEGNQALTKVMLPLLNDVRQTIGAEAKPTIVFDRGGFSPALFKQIRAAHFEFLTYRKGKYPLLPAKLFTDCVIRRGSKDVKVRLADVRIRLRGYGLVRLVAVARPDGKQTHVLTSRTDLSARDVLERMFNRWRQENFFKYLGESFAFDALWTYDEVDADPTRTVPNPERAAVDRQIAEQRRHLAKQRAALGETVEQSRPLDETARVADLEAQLERARAIGEREHTLEALRAQRKALAARVPVGTLRDGGLALELARAPMLLSDVIKMAAYHIECMLLAAVGPHLNRAPEEGRAFLQDAMHLDGCLTPVGDRLVVRLRPMSAPRYTRALEALCRHVNEIGACFPETTTRLHFEVATAVGDAEAP